jgi:DNA-binding LacI/PurR family transcriptional regulator
MYHQVVFMKLMQTMSKTEQVVNFLKEGLKAEKLPPGSKLQSSRTLAAKFATSKKVIESAFTILEKEGLVFKRARSGVFVNKVSELSHLKEVYILGVAVKQDSPYFGEILKITYSPLLKDGFSFITRTYSPGLSPEQVLKIEVNRINNMSEIDCVLINASPLLRKDVVECLRINKPVIFLGDFAHGEIHDLEFNQITGDNAYLAEQQLEYMHAHGHKSVTLFSTSLEHLFNRQAYNGARRKADELGLKFNVLEFPRGMSSLSEEKQMKIIKSTLKEAVDAGQIYKGVILTWLETDRVKTLLKQVNQTFYEELSFIPLCPVDYNPFRKAIISRVDELMLDRKETKKIRIKLPIAYM